MPALSVREDKIREDLENAWLRLGPVSALSTKSPFESRTPDDVSDPLRFLMKLARNPDYFGFTAKHFMGTTLLPFQLAVLRELWFRPFPLVVGSRGSSKSFMLAFYAMLRAFLCQGTKIVVVGAGLRQSKVIFDYCSALWDRAALLRDVCSYSSKNGPKAEIDRLVVRIGDSIITCLPLGDGCLTADTVVAYSDGFGTISDDVGRGPDKVVLERTRSVLTASGFRETDEAYRNGVADTLAVETVSGYRIEGTPNHRVRVFDASSDVVWRRLDEITQGDKVALDLQERWHEGRDTCLAFEAYACGAMLGAGSWSGEELSFRSPHASLRAAVRLGTGYAFADESGDLLMRHRSESDRRSFVASWGFRHKRAAFAARLPDRVRRCPKPAFAAFLRGLFDAAGRLEEGRLFLVTPSARLARECQFALTFFGILAGVYPGAERSWRLEVLDGRSFAAKVGTDLAHRRRGFARLRDVPRPHGRFFGDAVVAVEAGRAETFDIHVPEGHEYLAAGFVSHNTKIRGQRANVIIADEFASLSNEIFENVVAGFANVSMDPVEKVKQAAAGRMMAELGLRLPVKDETLAVSGLRSNQTVIAGSAYYRFNWFHDYWRRWKGIVESGGDRKKLADACGGEVDRENFDWRDYSVIRLPVELMPEGLMDPKNIAKARATLNSVQFLMEMGACFPADSNGFFSRRVVEGCVAGRASAPITLPSCGVADFPAALAGRPGSRYVIAVDPASESDNFAVVVLELWPDHRRIVHVWTTTRKSQKERAAGEDFYGHVCRKIRRLMSDFPCERLALDMQGGGIPVLEELGKSAGLPEGELPVLPVREEGKAKGTDNLPGLHIIVPIQFANAAWVAEANHGLRKDLEDKVLLFPACDSAERGLAVEDDRLLGRESEGLEACLDEIDELKDELASIVVTRTASGDRDRWDTPETRLPGGKKGRQRKDRYSALLMANMVARTFVLADNAPRYAYAGGAARDLAARPADYRPGDAPRWANPSWYGGGPPAVVVRRGR